MPALSFKKQFVEKILSGEKKQTIRAERKRPIRTGDRLYLYIGMRTKYCKKIGEAICTEVLPIIIKNTIQKEGTVINVDGKDLTPPELNILAMDDGFQDYYEFLEYFVPISPFSGQIIKWESLEEAG